MEISNDTLNLVKDFFRNHRITFRDSFENTFQVLRVVDGVLFYKINKKARKSTNLQYHVEVSFVDMREIIVIFVPMPIPLYVSNQKEFLVRNKIKHYSKVLDYDSVSFFWEMDDRDYDYFLWTEKRGNAFHSFEYAIPTVRRVSPEKAKELKKLVLKFYLSKTHHLIKTIYKGSFKKDNFSSN